MLSATNCNKWLLGTATECNRVARKSLILLLGAFLARNRNRVQQGRSERPGNRGFLGVQQTATNGCNKPLPLRGRERKTRSPARSLPFLGLGAQMYVEGRHTTKQNGRPSPGAL